MGTLGRILFCGTEQLEGNLLPKRFVPSAEKVAVRPGCWGYENLQVSPLEERQLFMTAKAHLPMGLVHLIQKLEVADCLAAR